MPGGGRKYTEYTFRAVGTPHLQSFAEILGRLLCEANGCELVKARLLRKGVEVPANVQEQFCLSSELPGLLRRYQIDQTTENKEEKL